MSTQSFGRGKYEVISRLGRGGMAEVYRAKQASLDRDVAIKVLHPFLADDPEFKSRFTKEARNIARLKHPNIVQVYDFENDDDNENYFMVMELVEGPTLKELLTEMTDQGRLLSIRESVRIIREAASALAYAHSQSMIHRDVKPANLMVDNNNRVVLTDFGIAKIVTGVQFTASGGMVGTPAYMSPEQGLGEQGDERSDLYSLGVIFYQMLTGRLPYDGDTPLAVILKHLNEPVMSPKALQPDLPDTLDRIVTRLMAKEPADRYQTAQELIADLERFERTTSDQQLDVQASAPAPVGRDVPEHLTKPFPDEGRNDRHKTPVTGTKVPQYEKSAPAPNRPRKAASSPPQAPPVPRAPRRGIPIWLWILFSALIGGIIWLVTWGSGGQLLGLLGQLPTPTAAVVIITSTTEVLTETPTVKPPTLTQTVPSATPNTIIVTATEPPSQTPTQTATATRRPPSVTPSATRTPSVTPSPTVTLTPTTDFGATQTAFALQAQIVTLTIAACRYDWEEVSRTLYNQNGTEISDGSIASGQQFRMEITLRNTGNCAWEFNTNLRFVAGEFFDSLSGTVLRIENQVPVGATYQLVFEGVAPRENGVQTGRWELRTPGDRLIGLPDAPLEISIRVFGA